MHRPNTQVTYQGISPKPELCLGERETCKTQEQIQSIMRWRRWDQTASWKGQGSEKAGAGEKEQMDQTRSRCSTSCGVRFPSCTVLSGAGMLLQAWGAEHLAALGFHRTEQQPQPNRTEQQFKGILGNFSFSLGKITQQFANQGRIFLKVLLITQEGSLLSIESHFTILLFVGTWNATCPICSVVLVVLDVFFFSL